jgi:glycosyltransferase involved in cell wall biosynthesis
MPLLKKILYIVSTLKRSGPTNALYNLIKHIDYSDFEVYILTLSPEPGDSRRKEFLNLGVHLYSLNLSRIKGLFFAKKHIQSFLAEIKPHLIHTQGIRSDIISANLKMNIPQLSTIRNFPQYDYIMTYGRIIGSMMIFQHINALHKMSACIGVSNAVTENLRNKYNISNVFCIQNGVDTDVFSPQTEFEKENLRQRLHLPLNTKIFISSGHLSELKNPMFLINIWKTYFNENNDAHLIFIGDGKLRKECEREARNFENIHVIGRVNNVVDYLRTSDYFISASYTEGFPNAVLEAMACGLPVLLSNIGPHKEILDTAYNAGFCYELDNKDSFNKSFNELLYSDRTTMSSTALKFVKEKANALIMAKNYQKIYQKLIV